MSGRLRLALTVVAGLVLIAVPAWLARLILTSPDSSRMANTIQGVLAPVAIGLPLLIALRAWWRKTQRNAGPAAGPPIDRLDAAADRIALRMGETWRQEARHRGIELPTPALVRWRWGTPDVALARHEISVPLAPGLGPAPLSDLSIHTTEQPLGAGEVTRLHDDVYLRLPHGRLVLLGAAGSGKTGAMVLIMLAALHHRFVAQTVSPQAGSALPVPVWLTLGHWNPDTASLAHWAEQSMIREHPYLRAAEYGPDCAAALIRDRRVTLFLDGLDEMPEALRTPALQRLHDESDRLRIVLTSRTAEYSSAVAHDLLKRAAVVELLPLPPQASAEYLTRDQVVHASAWQLLGQYLQTRPETITAQTLNTPLTLSLVRAAYRDRDPSELTDPAAFSSAEALRRHLFARFLATAYPDPRELARATTWLAWLAHQLGPNRDLAWWMIPFWAPWWVRTFDRALFSTLLTGTALAAVFSLQDNRWWAGVSPILGLLSWFGLTFFTSDRIAKRQTPSTLTVRWPRVSELVSVGVFFGIIAGFAGPFFAFVAGADEGVPINWDAVIPLLVAGTGLGLLGPLVFQLLTIWAVPIADAPSATPGSSYRADRRSSTISAASFGLGAGVLALLAAGLFEVNAMIPGLQGVDLAELLIWGPPLAVAIASTVGYEMGFMTGPAATLICRDQVRRFGRRRRGRTMAVLSRAHERQVLRQAGTFYQFRHAELQDYLAEQHR